MCDAVYVCVKRVFTWGCYVYDLGLNAPKCSNFWTTNHLIQLLVNQLPFVTIVVCDLTCQNTVVNYSCFEFGMPKIQLTIVISSELNIQLTKVRHSFFTDFCCSQCCIITSVLFVLLMYMEVVEEPNNVSDCIKVYLDDPQWAEHIKDPQQKKIKRQTSSNI